MCSDWSAGQPGLLAHHQVPRSGTAQLAFPEYPLCVTCHPQWSMTVNTRDSNFFLDSLKATGQEVTAREINQEMIAES